MKLHAIKGLLTRIELQQEKQKDYRNVVILQVLIITLGLLSYGPLLEDSTSSTSKFLITLFSGFGVIYAFLLWDLLRNFTANRILIVTILAVLVGISIFGILIEFPYYKILEVENRQASLLLIHGLLFPVEITVIGYAIKDIFMGQYYTPDKLWGSACVFLMIGISFGSLYDLICIANPGSLGVEIELGLPNYSECISYSFHVLGGIDTDYPDAKKLIKNISVIEAVWGNLFTVLIIGKLMILPKGPEHSEFKQTRYEQP
jgi:hypothetical protein